MISMRRWSGVNGFLRLALVFSQARLAAPPLCPCLIHDPTSIRILMNQE
jgi:hypothetical protein